MIAHIQLPNVAFFRRLGWRLAGDVESYAGLPHQPMSIGLPSAATGARVAEDLRTGVTASR